MSTQIKECPKCKKIYHIFDNYLGDQGACRACIARPNGEFRRSGDALEMFNLKISLELLSRKRGIKMGKEIRKVPPNYEHPIIDCHHWPLCNHSYIGVFGKCYQPQNDKNFQEAVKEWVDDFMDFLKQNPNGFNKDGDTFWEWRGNPPEKEYYRHYKNDEATWYQVYQTVSEGTPVTPPFATEEELINYLVKNGDFWDQERENEGKRKNEKYTYEVAYKFVKSDKWAPSIVFIPSESKILRGIECAAAGIIEPKEGNEK